MTAAYPTITERLHHTVDVLEKRFVQNKEAYRHYKDKTQATRVGARVARNIADVTRGHLVGWDIVPVTIGGVRRWVPVFDKHEQSCVNHSPSVAMVMRGYATISTAKAAAL